MLGIVELNEIFTATELVLPLQAAVLGAFGLRRTHLSREWSAPFVPIDQSQHREGAIGVLAQATIPGFGKAPEGFQGSEHMLYLGPYRRLAPVGLPVCRSERAVAVSPFVGEVR